MGSCLSKKEPCRSSTPPEPVKPVSKLDGEDKAVRDEKRESKAKKEIFVIKHKRSNEGLVRKDEADSSSNCTATGSSESGAPEVGHNLIASNINLILNGTAHPRASSCTKEEVDAILIQCGRLSRSSSGARKYSGSKRSYDFDNDTLAGAGAGGEDGSYGDEEDDGPARIHRQSRGSPQGRRRRTPSRERDQRSNSRERNVNGGGGSRRVSRSPARRSENNSSITTNGNGNGNSNRPGKMVSVPATVTSLNNSGAGEPVIKRVTVKRNVSSPRTRSPARACPNGCSENPRARSPARTNPNGCSENPRAWSPARTNPNGFTENPRARSPARTNPNGCNENQQQGIGRSSSRKGEQSPYRRNPLSEIDLNSLAYPQPCKNNYNNNTRNQINSREFETDGQKPNFTSSRGTQENKAMNVTLTRSRSSRRSQDLDFNNETLLNPNPNPNPSYTSLLLEDIQNFHQKNTTTLMTPPSFSLPACVTKACSIVEAVADLNSCTSSSLTDQISAKRRQVQQQQQKSKDPFVESEVVVSGDLMEPSFHKYVTVRRGGEIEEEEESSGSNSFLCVGGQQYNSADSTDRSREIEEARRGFSGKRRDFDHHHHQIIAAAST